MVKKIASNTYLTLKKCQKYNISPNLATLLRSQSWEFQETALS